MAEHVTAAVEQGLIAAFGSVPARASMSFVGVEPIEVLRFDTPGALTYVTLGMSRRPMSASDSYLPAVDGPRAELLVHSRRDGGGLWRRLAVLAAAPAVEGVVYTDGMTVDTGEPWDRSSICVGGIIVAADLAPVPTPVGEVALLELLPATSTELAYSRVRGSPALRAQWEQAGTDLLDLARAAVAFD